jgi:transposase InsO family protein
LLAGELLATLAEARWLLERWHLEENHRRPHSALGCATPAAYAVGMESAGV